MAMETARLGDFTQLGSGGMKPSKQSDNVPVLYSGDLIWLVPVTCSKDPTKGPTKSPQPRPQRLYAKVYRTAVGRMAVLWKDKREVQPLGCLNLKDAVVQKSVLSEDCIFTVKPYGSDYDAGATLTFLCESSETLEEWVQAFHCPPVDSVRKNGHKFVSRLASVEEEA